jgi:hypothetical protein
MLQGILQGAGPVGCGYKVFTGRAVEREFKASLLTTSEAQDRETGSIGSIMPILMCFHFPSLHRFHSAPT